MQSIADKWPKRNSKSMTIYGAGIMLDAKSTGGNKAPVGGPRGKIRGWTYASRKRMREFLLRHRPIDGHASMNVTLTIPGPVVSPESEDRIWRAWKQWVSRSDASCVWRKELQTRGQVHWHCLMGVPVESYSDLREAVRAIRDGWLRSCDVLGTELSRWIGAREHACDIVYQDDTDWTWLRYMQDHATKVKQSQVAAGHGRHWGVLGRKHLEVIPETSKSHISSREFAKVLRILRKMHRRRLKCDADPRGYRHGRESRRGRWGKTVWFGNPETFRRILEYVRSS